MIAYGQVDSGKSYTVLGPGMHCALSETEYGMLPRTCREVFNKMKVCYRAFLIVLYSTNNDNTVFLEFPQQKD
jgi:Kinesin motor domain